MVLRHKNSFCLHVQLAPFCIKTNLRENRLFATRRAIDGEKSTQNVKIYTEKRTDLINELTRRQETKITRNQEHKLAKERVNKWMRSQVNK